MTEFEFQRAVARRCIYLSIALLTSACSSEKTAPPRPMPVPVRVAEARLESFPLQLKALGTVTALNTVTVRSRIDGELVSVLFEEGQFVKQGQLLAEIDPRPHAVALAQAVGQQRENHVQLQNAEAELARLAELLTKNYVSKQALNNQEALVRQYRARLESFDAAVASAKLQLEYTRIVAPIGGRLGLRRIDPGNLIRTGDTQGLVTITQVQPINVVFTVPETAVGAVVDAYRDGPALAVEAWDRTEQQRLAAGELASLDNQIDTATGTLRLKAAFANTDGRLFPNQFVNVRLRVRTLDDAVVIPGAAVQYGAQGTYVFVIHDKKASLRPVTLGASDNDRLVITQGVKAGERVVLEGLDRLRDGREVSIVGDAEPAAGASNDSIATAP